MLLKRLTIENYKSFREETILDFGKNYKNEDSNKNIMLIGGMNGAGKTSILEAINIALYGVASTRDLFKAINKEAKREGKIDVYFALTLELDDGSDLEIKRYRKDNHTGKGPLDHNSFESYLKIAKNGQALSIGDESTRNDFINATLPKGVSQFFFFDGEKIKTFADDQSPSTLKKSMEEVLGLERINRLIDDLNKVKKEEEKKISSVTGDDKIDFIKGEMELFKKRKEILDGNIKMIQGDINDLEEEAQKKTDQFHQKFGFNPEKQEELIEISNQEVTLKGKLNNIESQIITYCNEFLPFLLLGQFLPIINYNIEYAKQSNKQRSLSDAHEEIIEKIINSLYKPHEIISKTPRNQRNYGILKEKILLSLSDEKRFDENKFLLNLGNKEERELIAMSEDIRKKINYGIIPLIDEKELLIGEIGALEKKRKELEIDPDKQGEYELLLNERDGLMTQMGKKKSDLGKYLEERSQLEVGIEQKERELLTLGEHHNKNTENKRFIKAIDMYIRILLKYTEILRSTKIAELEDAVTGMYKQLSSRGDMIKNVSINSESFYIDIQDINGLNINKSQMSEGEKEIFSISLIRGLAKTSHLNIPILIDAPLAVLDSFHAKNVINKYFPSASHQVIILSKDTDLPLGGAYYNFLQKITYNEITLFFDKEEKETKVLNGYYPIKHFADLT